MRGGIGRVAVHEAGHVVACIVQGLCVSRVDIQNGSGGGGVDMAFNKAAPNWWRSAVRVLLAGGVAEMIAFEGTEPGGQAQDLVEACALVEKVHGAGSHCEGVMNRLRLETFGLLTVPVHWDGVEVIAEALEERRSMSGDEIRSLIQARQEMLQDKQLVALQERLAKARENYLAS